MQKHIYALRHRVDSYEWRARSRRDFVYSLIQKYAKHPTNILDLGCGTGALIDYLSSKYPNAQITGLDVSSDAIKFCKSRGVHAKMFNGKKIPYKNSTFELVTAVDVLEHIEDDTSMLREIQRVLKPRGWAVLVVPAYPSLWTTRDTRLGHFRRYHPDELEKRSSKVGLHVLASKKIDFLLFLGLQVIRQFAKKRKGVSDLKTDVTNPTPFINEILYWYTRLENIWQQFSTFPVGTSIALVVQKK